VTVLSSFLSNLAVIDAQQNLKAQSLRDGSVPFDHPMAKGMLPTELDRSAARETPDSSSTPASTASGFLD
jgi:hypothetical protein